MNILLYHNTTKFSFVCVVMNEAYAMQWRNISQSAHCVGLHVDEKQSSCDLKSHARDLTEHSAIEITLVILLRGTSCC
jgi:hypothetical protein